MIKEKSRAHYIGASDATRVCTSFDTKGFRDWWLVKLGLIPQRELKSIYIEAGNNYEHEIIESLQIPNIELDKQIIIGRLRVNLDANTATTIYEVKTHKIDKPMEKVPKNYWRQCQVQMYASGLRECYIVSYSLTDDDYRNFFNKIDKNRLKLIKVEYDEKFINEEFLPRFRYLEKCLNEGKFPSEVGYKCYLQLK